MQKLNIEELEKEAQILVENAKVPVTVDYIARQLHVAWGTGRSLLLSLALKGHITAIKTMKSWIFQPAPEKKGTPA
jgi:predicted Rossmann fold nucleotide-binding protein DprA/Smf involved in DNA uptake